MSVVCITRMARGLLSFISILFLGELHAMGLLYVLVCCFTSMLFSDLVHAIGLLYVSYEMRRCVLQCFSLCITRNGANVHIVYIIRNRGLCLLYKTPVLLKGIAMFCCITHFFYISFSLSLFLPLSLSPSLSLSIYPIYLSVYLSIYIYFSLWLTHPLSGSYWLQIIDTRLHACKAIYNSAFNRLFNRKSAKIETNFKIRK